MPSEHDHISMCVYLLPIIIIKWGRGGVSHLIFRWLGILFRIGILLYCTFIHLMISGDNKTHLAQYFGIRFIIYHLSCSRQQNKETKRKKKETGIQWNILQIQLKFFLLIFLWYKCKLFDLFEYGDAQCFKSEN